MVNICLIGGGEAAPHLAKLIHHNPQSTLISVVDPTKEKLTKFTKKNNISVYQSVEEAFANKNVDGVVIADHPSSQGDHIIATAKARLPIFCDRLIDLSIKKTDECLAIINQKEVPFFVAFPRRFDPSFRSLKNRIADGDIGAVETISITNRWPTCPSIDQIKNYGGIFRDLSIDDFDLARWLLEEEPTQVQVMGSCLINPKIKTLNDADTVMITLKTSSGILCHINNSRRCAYGFDQRVEVFGSDGSLIVKNMTPTAIEHVTIEGSSCQHPYTHPTDRYANAYQLELQHFLQDVIGDGSDPKSDESDGRQALVIAKASAHAFKKGQTIDIPAPIKRKRGLLEAIFS